MVYGTMPNFTLISMLSRMRNEKTPKNREKTRYLPNFKVCVALVPLPDYGQIWCERVHP